VITRFFGDGDRLFPAVEGDALMAGELLDEVYGQANRAALPALHAAAGAGLEQAASGGPRTAAGCRVLSTAGIGEYLATSQ
jgi:hypothetical protein